MREITTRWRHSLTQKVKFSSKIKAQRINYPLFIDIFATKVELTENIVCLASATGLVMLHGTCDIVLSVFEEQIFRVGPEFGFVFWPWTKALKMTKISPLSASNKRWKYLSGNPPPLDPLDPPDFPTLYCAVIHSEWRRLAAACRSF